MMPATTEIPTDTGATLKPPAWLPKDLSMENGMMKGIPEQMQRALAVAAYFFSGVVAINTSQMLAAPMSAINNDWYEGWLSLTKQSFGLLTTTMTQFWAPTVMRVSGDQSMRGQLLQSDEGDLICNFPDRLVLMANHQIYTDWLYLWWVAYTAGRHGNVYIILKESLKKIPVIGWGMQLNKFIFLKRNWEQDKPHLSAHMRRLDKLAEPMWLMLFPEGTNLAPDTRIKSRKWAAKNHLKDMQHTLLPRSTGLRFCLQELKASTHWVYDCTVAYSGVPRGKYAQDIYTLRASYLEGRPPKSVNMYWRRFRVADIPLDNPLAFESWLLARWREKDALMEHYYKHGKFPADTGISMESQGQFLRGAGHIESEVRASKWRDFLQVFAPMGMLALVLFMFYGALPKEMIGSIGDQAGAIGKMIEDEANGGSDGKEKKLLAFDGAGFKQISAGSKELADAVKEGMSRPPIRRADSVSSMSSGPKGAPSTVQREGRRMLGYSGGRFRAVSPARSVTSTKTAPGRTTAPKLQQSQPSVKSSQVDRDSGAKVPEQGPENTKQPKLQKSMKISQTSKPAKLLGLSGGEYREVSKPFSKSTRPGSKSPAQPVVTRAIQPSADRPVHISKSPIKPTSATHRSKSTSNPGAANPTASNVLNTRLTLNSAKPSPIIPRAAVPRAQPQRSPAAAPKLKPQPPSSSKSSSVSISNTAPAQIAVQNKIKASKPTAPSSSRR